MPYYPPASGGGTTNQTIISGGMSKISRVQPYDCYANFAGANGSLLSKSGTVTGTAGFGSSLFLKAITVPAPMSLSCVEAAFKMAFPNTSQGAGTISRSFALYSYGNSSSLATLCSASNSSSWNTGTTTAGASSSLTQFQIGWELAAAASPLLTHDFTFASTTIPAGEYVVGQIFDFAQASSTWSVAFGGQAGTGLTAGLLYSVPSAAASGITGTAAASGITGVSSYGSQFLALSTAGSMTAFRISGTLSTAASSISAPIGASASTATVSGISRYDLTLTNSAKSASFQLAGESSNSNIISSIGTAAGSIITGLTAGSVLTAAAQSVSAPQIVRPAPRFLGSGSNTTNNLGPFIEGTSSTGAFPASFAITDLSFQSLGLIPWFALVGS